jgi:hypothetical protein
MNFKTHAPARREGTTLQPNIHKEPCLLITDAVRSTALSKTTDMITPTIRNTRGKKVVL